MLTDEQLQWLKGEASQLAPAPEQSPTPGHAPAQENGGAKALSIVAPCYNEEATLEALLKRTGNAARSVVGSDYEIVLVDDGSQDNTWPLIETRAVSDPNIVAIKLSRNHGHQIALTAGLAAAKGALIFVIDADLQDPPELLGEMLSVMISEHADVVYGRRKSRDGETWFKKATASAFYRSLESSSKIDIPLDAGDFRLMTKRVADALVAMPEPDRFVRGMVAWIGYKQVPFDYEREARHAGETKYTLRKMVRLAADAFMGFSMAPLRLAAKLSILMFLILTGVIAFAFISWLMFDTVSGWTSMMVLVSFASAMQFAVLAIMGEYLGRTYLASKSRPLFMIDQVVRGEASRHQRHQSTPRGSADEEAPETPPNYRRISAASNS